MAETEPIPDGNVARPSSALQSEANMAETEPIPDGIVARPSSVWQSKANMAETEPIPDGTVAPLRHKPMGEQVYLIDLFTVDAEDARSK